MPRQERPRGFGFCQRQLGCPVASHVACGQIAQADLQAERGVTRDDAAEADFDVIGMRSEYEQIDGHAGYRSQRKPNASSAGETSSR